MTKDMALQVMDFALSLNLDDNAQFIFWGGEPLEKFAVIKEIIDAYPQLKYCIVTNGNEFTEEMSQFLCKVCDLSVIWSVGDAYEKFGSIENKVKASLITKFIRNRHSISFLVQKPETFYEDYKFLRTITSEINVDLPMKFNVINNDTFIDEFVKVLNEYGNIVIGGRDIDRHLETGWKFCNCGLDRILFDGSGQIWRCDGAYLNQIDRFGDIYKGIDWSKLDHLWELKENPERMSKGCEECFLWGSCPRVKCLGDNYEATGDALLPDKVFCESNRTIMKGIRRYKNA
jgi:radical SAM protein with 4Fe4S-binding SPASM domain